MPQYRFQMDTTSLILEDSPIGYTPARGPSVSLDISYSHREATQPQIFGYSNMGPKWTFNWVRYVREVPMDAFGTTPPHVQVILPPGGYESYVNADANGVYPAHWYSRAELVRVSSTPIVYERRLPDHTIEVYGASDGGPAGSRRIFLTELIDPLGQRMQFTWDGQARLVGITDALGQVTTLAYDDATDPLKITKVTDPFARTATFTYNAAGQLASTTDVMGLTSSFTYADGDFISSMTTPYGTTSFRHELNWLTTANLRYVEATDPLGGTEHLEFQYDSPSLPLSLDATEVPTGFTGWNNYLNRYNSFYWDKRAWMLGKNDLTKATNTHWMVRGEWDGWQK